MPRPWETAEPPQPTSGGDIICAAYDECGACEAWVDEQIGYLPESDSFAAWWHSSGPLERSALYTLFCQACDYTWPPADLSSFTVSDR